MSSILSVLSPASLPPSTISLSPSTTPLPALTTIFTPPSSCLSTLSSYSADSTKTYFELAPLSKFPQCYPSSATNALTFSPAICPGGYVSVDKYLIVRSSNTDNTVTEMRCCPRTLSMTSTYVGSCRIDTSNSVIWAPMIFARYQSTDVAIANSWSSLLGKAVSSSISSRGSSSSSTSPSSSIASQTPSPSQFPPDPSRLSAGAIAGIVIGAVAGFLFLLGSLILLLQWRKRKQAIVAANPVEERKWNDDSRERRWEEAGESRRL